MTELPASSRWRCAPQSWPSIFQAHTPARQPSPHGRDSPLIGLDACIGRVRPFTRRRIRAPLTTCWTLLGLGDRLDYLPGSPVRLIYSKSMRVRPSPRALGSFELLRKWSSQTNPLRHWTQVQRPHRRRDCSERPWYRDLFWARTTVMVTTIRQPVSLGFADRDRHARGWSDRLRTGLVLRQRCYLLR